MEFSVFSGYVVPSAHVAPTIFDENSFLTLLDEQPTTMTREQRASIAKRQRRAISLGAFAISFPSHDVAAFTGVREPAHKHHMLQRPRGTMITKLNAMVEGA